MNIFGIGPLEIAYILILVIIIFGPNDLIKTSKTIGTTINKIVRSDTWKNINQTTQELKKLPNRLMKESGLDELEKMNKEGIIFNDNFPLPQDSDKKADNTSLSNLKTPQEKDPTDSQKIDQVKPIDRNASS